MIQRDVHIGIEIEVEMEIEMAIEIDRETDEGIEMEIDMRKHRHGHRQILSRRETPYVILFDNSLIGFKNQKQKL